MAKESVIPQEALAYLKRKGLKPGFDYRDVWQSEHGNSFTVAKMMQLDMLEDTKKIVEQALEQGWTYQQFRDNLKPMLVKRGWWGVQTMDDPLTGETKMVQLGSDNRLKTIYRTNMRTARAAGQWERIERSKETHPYLLYELGPSREHRLEHVQWNGLLLPVDDSFWHTHYPANGWGCKCRVRQVSQREADRLQKTGINAGIQEINAKTGLPTGRFTDDHIDVKTHAPKVELREWTNKRTGEVEQVPKGIDPGWAYNAGNADAQKLKQYTQKLNAAEPSVAKASIQQSLSSERFKEWYDAPSGNFPVGIIDLKAQEKIGAKVQTTQLSTWTTDKQHQKHPELNASEYSLIQQTIDQGEVIQDTVSSLIYIHEQAGYVSVVKATKSGEGVFLSSFRRLSNDEAKRDKELIRLRKKGKS